MNTHKSDTRCISDTVMNQIQELLFFRVLHTMCCHIRTHAFTHYVIMMMSSGEQGSYLAGNRGDGALFAVLHSGR